MQPPRGATGAAVEAEGEGPLARVADIILGIGDVEDAGLGRAVFQFQEEGAGRRGVLDLLPADPQRMLRLNNFFFGNGRLLFFFRLFRRFIRLRRFFLFSEKEIRSPNYQPARTSKTKRPLHCNNTSLLPRS